MRSLVILLVVLAVAFACPSQVIIIDVFIWIPFNFVIDVFCIWLWFQTGFKIHQKRSIQHQGREDKPLNWLEKGLVYQIYPRSFQDRWSLLCVEYYHVRKTFHFQFCVICDKAMEMALAIWKVKMVYSDILLVPVFQTKCWLFLQASLVV